MNDALVALERRLWTEATAALYEEYLTDDALMVFAEPAGVLDKRATVAAVEENGPWETVDLHDVRTIELSDDATVLVYRARGVRGGGPPYETWATSVYVRQDEGPRLALHQQS